MTLKEYLSAQTPDDLLSHPETEGGSVFVYSSIEMDRLIMLGNSIGAVNYMKNVIDGTEEPVATTPRIDEALLKAVKGAGFGAYCELRAVGLGFEASELLLEEGIPQKLA